MGLAIGILVAVGAVFAVYAKVVGGRTFDAPTRPSSPRQYW